MKEVISPGLMKLREAMASNPKMIDHAASLERLLVAASKDLDGPARAALLASSLGYSLGHGACDGDCDMADLEVALDYVNEIIEASAVDAFQWHRRGGV